MIVKRFDGQTYKLDLLESPPPNEIQFFVNKKALPAVVEATEEVMKITRMTM